MFHSFIQFIFRSRFGYKGIKLNNMYQKNDIKVENEEIYLLPQTNAFGELIIGGKEEAEQMIIDLREAVEKLN